MAIEKIKNFADYDNYPADSNPTTNANMQDYMSNQNNVLKALTNVLLWQPQTNYIAGQEVHSPDMPVGYVALCSVAGQSGLTQPNWNSTSKTYTDGGVTWEITKRINVYQGVENADKVLMVGKNGEVSPQDSGKLPLSGGIMTGDIYSYITGNNYFHITNGKGGLNQSRLSLGNTVAQNFWLVAGDGTQEKQLIGNADGTLSWNGDNVIIGKTLKEWTDDSWLDICGGTAWNQGACINLTGKNSERNGSFFIMARANDDTVSTLNGYANGVLQWNNKEIERLEASGNGFIRYANGLQMCYGDCRPNDRVSNSSTYVTFAVPFANNCIPTILISPNANNNTVVPTIGWETNLGFHCGVLSGSSGNGVNKWFAIGWWK